jgi:hypothetical protein
MAVILKGKIRKAKGKRMELEGGKVPGRKNFMPG